MSRQIQWSFFFLSSYDRNSNPRLISKFWENELVNLVSVECSWIELLLLTMQDKQYIMTKEALRHQLAGIIFIEQMVHWCDVMSCVHRVCACR